MSKKLFPFRRCLRAVSQAFLAVVLLAGSAPFAPELPPAAAVTAPLPAVPSRVQPAPLTPMAPRAAEVAAPEPPPAADLPAEVAGKPEVVAERTADSATYDLGDGKYALVQDSQPMHYQDADGAWRRIDPAFVAETGGWINRTNALKTGVGARSGRANLTHGQLGVGWTPHTLQMTDAAGNATPWATVLAEAAALTGTLGADARSVTYPAAWSEPTLLERWVSGYGQSEYSLQIAEQPEKRLLSQAGFLELRVTLHLFPGTQLQMNGAPITTDTLPLETSGALTFVSDSGETLALQPPQAYEAGHPAERVAGSYTLAAGKDATTLELAARIPADWLAAADRQYPVVLDPVFQVKTPTTAKIAFYSNEGAHPFSSWYSADPVIDIGQYADGVTRAYLRFAMPSLPSSVQIDDAYLQVLPQNGWISCDYDIENPDICFWDTGANAGMRYGLVAQVGVYKPSYTAEWWNSDAAPPAPGDLGDQDELRWDVTAGGDITRLDIPNEWIEDWRTLNGNRGVILKLVNEFCYTSTPIVGWGTHHDIRHFPDGCGVFEMQSPTVYDPSAAATDFGAMVGSVRNGGIRLIVTYTGPTLYRNIPINGMIGEGVTAPSLDSVYYNADHEYRLESALAGQWQVLYLRGLGAWTGPNPPTEANPGPRQRWLGTGLPIDLYTSNDQPLNRMVDPYQVEPGKPGVGFALFDGNASTAAFRARVKAPGAAVSNGYEIGLKTQIASLSTLGVAPGDTTPNVTYEFNFPTSEAVAVIAIEMKAGTNSRIDISGDQQFDDDPLDTDAYLRAWLFESDGTGVRLVGKGEPLDGSGYALSTGDRTPQPGAKYALVLTYNGPDMYYYGETITSTTEHRQYAMLHQSFDLTVRATSCPSGEFPLSTGECQRVECPATADLSNTALYREAGGFGLWSDSGWSSAGSPATSNSGGNAPLIGPPGAAPTVAIIEGRLTYDTAAGTTVTITDGKARVKLVDCNELGDPSQDLTDSHYFDVYKGLMQRSLDGATPVLEPTYGAGGKLFQVWHPNDTGSLSAEALRVRPLTGDAQGAARLARDMAGEGAGSYALTVDVAWTVTVAGWPSLDNTATLVGNPTPPTIAGLLLDLGDAYQMDVSAAQGKQVPRTFDAVRATDATISQPANMGGASESLQAVILPRDRQDATLGLYCANKSCVDLRAPNDVYPGAPKRTWKMPDIHTNNTAGMFMMSMPGSVQVWSADHPAMANSPNATGEEFSFNTSGASVRITQEKCSETDATETQVIRGETLMTLPMIGEGGATQDTMIAARFKLCSVPDVALRMVEFEFRSPIGVPVGSSGLFVYGMKGNVTIEPDHVNITFGMDFYFGDPNTLQGTGEVMIDTRGYFEFSGNGKLLGTVDANGRLWVAWNPLDTGFEMSLHYGLGSIAAIDGTVRAHAWRGQGWQHKYSWLPDDPSENHFAAQIAASFTIYEGSVIDIWPLVVPPVDFSRSIEIAFGQFCTNAGCSTYEWGIKAALEVCGYSVGVYYGFDHGVSLILGNDGHTLIDQYGDAAYAAQVARIPLAAGEELGLRTPGVAIQTAPLAVNGVVSFPVTVTVDTEELLVGVGWQTDDTLVLELYRPGSAIPVGQSALYNVAISNTTKTQDGIVTHSRLIGVQIKQSGLDGIWEARLSGVTPESHYKFAFLANKGAPGTRADRGEFTEPGSADVQSPGMTTLRWTVYADAPANTTISLYASQYVKIGTEYFPIPNATSLPIVQNHSYHQGYFNWHTSGRVQAKCVYSDDDRCYYLVRAVVDDGVNDLPDDAITDSGDPCKTCNEPSARAFDPDRFPGTSVFTSTGHIWMTDSVAPAAPTGVDATGIAGALMVRWNRSVVGDLQSYLVEWGRVTCPAMDPCTWDAGEPSHAERVAPILTPTLRIGGVTTEGMVLGDSYGVVVSAIDINGNVSARSDIDNARPTSDAGVQIPAAPNTPTLSLPTSTSIRLSWTSHGAPDHYRLIYRQVITFAAVMQKDNIPATYHMGNYSSGAKQLTGLETGATYVAWVTAANSNGWHSPYSPPVTFTVSSGVDSDGDGMPDDWEALNQISLGHLDADRDGLDNLGEYRAGTQPYEKDSDNDGYSDGEEIAGGSNPLDRFFYPPAYTLPRLALASNRVNFYAKVGGNESLFKDVDFYNVGGGTLDLSASETMQWLSANVEAGVGKNYVRLLVNTTNLAPGIYDAIVRVSHASGNYYGKSQCIRVRLHLLPADTQFPKQPLYLPLVMRSYPPQWVFTLVDPNGDAGQYASVAIDPRNGTPYISYYDAGNGNLRMVNPVGEHHGNCGPDVSWRCEIVKTDDDVGRYSSIALWSDDSVWKIGIAYYNDTTDSLEYAEFIEGGSWTFTVVDAGEPTLNIRDGRYASLKFNASGAPRIAYYHSQFSGGNALKFAEYVGGSGGNCSDPAWQCNSIESGDSVGSHAALDLDDADRPHIAYYDSANDLLRYTRLLGGGSGNCGPSNDWQCITIEAAEVPTFTTRLIGLNAISLDEAQIAYVTLVSEIPTLRYANPGDGDCGPNNDWFCMTITKNVNGVALATQGDAARIAYHDTTDNTLNIARRAGPKEVGNCGAVGLIRVWTCIGLEAGGAYPAIALRPGNLAIIAHYEETSTALRVVRQNAAP
ncbi:MAG TPA: fibronectin type III domain-containing protein [Anaerolineae bacterium]|nr:fibronectin type III domain-containing protein [Anaerolineae bacterium]